MYKETNSEFILRETDEALIPRDALNSDYQRFLEWVAEGNTIEPYAQEPKPDLTKIFKSEIWRRATNAEAVTIKAGLLQQEIRLQELWASVSYISTTDELYTALRAGFVAAFGEARTNQLLEATE